MNRSAVSEEESKRRELVGFDWTGKEYRDQKVANQPRDGAWFEHHRWLEVLQSPTWCAFKGIQVFRLCSVAALAVFKRSDILPTPPFVFKSVDSA